MLFDAEEGSACSLEVLDDVAEEAADGTTTLSQSKSALTTNPVADRAESLWKTLANWERVARLGIVDPDKTTFEVYVSRPVSGNLIDAFHRAESLTQAKAALAKARQELWGDRPKYAKRPDLPIGLKLHADQVLEASEDLIIRIIANLRLKCGSGSPQFDIEAAIRRGPVSESRVFDIADHMCGWVKRNVDKQLEKAVPAFILRNDFHHEYVAYVRRIDRDIILKSLAGSPTDAEKRERLCDPFVRQLELIELNFDDQLEAISDFLRASSDRAKWSEAGHVHENSFAELDENLVRTWANHNRATTVEFSASPAVARGKLLHARCMNHQTSVQGMEPPGHFVPGCFHGLANDMVLGWHPTYRDLLNVSIAQTA